MQTFYSYRSLGCASRSLLRQKRTPLPSTKQLPLCAPKGCAAKCLASAAVQDNSSPQVYTNWTVYKGKAALSFKPIRPRWERSPSGNISLSREGALLLEFARSIEDKKYDWENKLTFGLSVVELVSVVQHTELETECSLFHDPGKMTSTEGQVTKSLKVSPMTGKDKGAFFSLNVRERGGGGGSVSVPITLGELGTLRMIAQFLVPRMLGFDEAFHYPPQFVPLNVPSETSLEHHTAKG